MSGVHWTVGLILLSSVAHAQFWGWGNFGLERSCGWKYGGQCKFSCDTGEYVFGPIPCGYGFHGICCAKDLECRSYGGECKQECNPSMEKELTFLVRCPSVSHTCCLRKPREVTPAPTTLAPTTTAPVNRRCSARPAVRISSRILGGSAVNSPCQWPWMVSIREVSDLNPTGHHICAGVLVATNKVLTTVECVRGRNIFVTLKENNIHIHGESGEVDIPVSSAPLIHHNYRMPFGQTSFFDNDIAIVTLDWAVPDTPCIEPVCLPLPGELPTIHSKCYIAGWGDNRLQQNDGKLHEARVTVLDSEICEQTIPASVTADLPSDKLCSSPQLDASDVCRGDNGGMLVCEDSQGVWSLFGLISDNACTLDLPAVYTNVQYHLDWINRNV